MIEGSNFKLLWFDMDDASDCQYIDYYSIYTFNIHVPYLIIFDSSESSFNYLMFTCLS